MLRAYTAFDIRAAEQPLLDAGQGPLLMQRAAHGLAAGVRSMLSARGRRSYGSRVVLLIGSGNNGGDALFAGALLAARGTSTTALLTSERVHPQALAAFIKAGGRVARVPEDTQVFLAVAELADVWVDGLLGIGGKGGLREPTASILARLCALQASSSGSARRRPAVVACDLPSGVDATTGQVHGPILAADATVTFGAAKTGLLCPPAEQYVGVLTVVDIGLSSYLPQPDLLRLVAADLAVMLPRPHAADQKYTRGVAGIVAGSAHYPGAALLALAAASACGPGMVRYVGPQEVQAAALLRSPEVVCSLEAPDKVHVQAWLVGCGIEGDDAQLGLARAVMGMGLPTVVDAGALPLVEAKRDQDVQVHANAHLVLTPHAGELATLLTRLGAPTSREEIESAPLASARQAAQLTGATVLLKGPTTVVAAPSGTVFTQADGTASLATAGSGDTLAGILVALLAMGAGQNVPGVKVADALAVAAALATSLHGRLAQLEPREPLNAGMLAARIPGVWAELLSRNPRL